MAIQNRETTLPGIWAENAQTDIPTPPIAGVTYRDTTLNSTAIDKAWQFKTIVDSSDFNQHAFLQDTLIKESEQYGIMRWNNTTTYKEGGFCLGKDGKLYQALRDNQGKEPTSSTDDWKVFTSGGGFPIGSIGYTLRTEVPEGGAWCDGAEYTKEMFPDIYQMLVDGKIQSTTYQNFTSSVSTNGYCGLFALDSSAQKFKVPKLLDKYVMDLADDVPVVGNGLALGLTNGTISGGLFRNSNTYLLTGSNLLGNPVTSSDQTNAGTVVNGVIGVTTDPEKSGMIADTSNLGKTVTLKAYVVLYSSAAGASEVQAAEFMTALDGKANVGLDNVTPSQSFKDMSMGWGMPDLTAGVNLTSGTTIPVNSLVYVASTRSPGNLARAYLDGEEMFKNEGGASTSDGSGATFLAPESSIYTSSGNFDKQIYYPLKGEI